MSYNTFTARLKKMNLQNDIPEKGEYCSAIITYIDDNQEYMVTRITENE